jgi:TRAP-type C4-dicarboxylate transport system substrate-binding protein
VRIPLIAAVLALALCGGGPVAAQADRPVVLKIASGLPAYHPLTPSLRAWAESLKKATGNTVTAMLVPPERLGKAGGHHALVREGTADLAYITPDATAGRFPILEAATLPLLVANARGGSAAVDAWYRQYAAHEMSDVKFCLAFVHEPGTLHARTRVVQPADVRGLRVRPATAALGRLVASLGGMPVEAAASQPRDLPARGAADAVTLPWASFARSPTDQALRHHLDLPLYVTPFAWVMNKRRYESLTPAQQRAVDDHCTSEWAERVATPWSEFESGWRARLAQAGHQVDVPAPEQLRAWREAAARVEAQWAEAVRRAGHDPKPVLDSLKAQLARQKAGV